MYISVCVQEVNVYREGHTWECIVIAPHIANGEVSGQLHSSAPFTSGIRFSCATHWMECV
jgi:hypothetical protein